MVAAEMREQRDERRRQQQHYRDMEMASLQQQREQQARPVSPPAYMPEGYMTNAAGLRVDGDVSDRLKKLAALKDEGLLDDEEYKAAKHKLLEEAGLS
jgi:hypothetical protein